MKQAAVSGSTQHASTHLVGTHKQTPIPKRRTHTVSTHLQAVCDLLGRGAFAVRPLLDAQPPHHLRTAQQHPRLAQPSGRTSTSCRACICMHMSDLSGAQSRNGLLFRIDAGVLAAPLHRIEATGKPAHAPTPPHPKLPLHAHSCASMQAYTWALLCACACQQAHMHLST